MGLTATRLKKGLENGGSDTQSKLESWPEDADEMGEQGMWKRKGGGGLVVRLGLRDVHSRPSSSTMMMTF